MTRREDWWRTLPTFWACHHPRADRYIPCAWVEKCGWCGAIRFTEEPFEHSASFWPPERGMDGARPHGKM